MVESVVVVVDVVTVLDVVVFGTAALHDATVGNNVAVVKIHFFSVLLWPSSFLLCGIRLNNDVAVSILEGNVAFQLWSNFQRTPPFLLLIDKGTVANITVDGDTFQLGFNFNRMHHFIVWGIRLIDNVAVVVAFTNIVVGSNAF